MNGLAARYVISRQRRAKGNVAFDHQHLGRATAITIGNAGLHP
jgi:hypothetical protein